MQLNRKVSELRAAGKLAEATPLAAQVVRLTEKRNGPYNPATAAALTSYADLLIAQKRYAEAEPILKRVAAIREKSKDTAGAAQALDNLGSGVRQAGPRRRRQVGARARDGDAVAAQPKRRLDGQEGQAGAAADDRRGTARVARQARCAARRFTPSPSRWSQSPKPSAMPSAPAPTCQRDAAR